MPYQGGGEALVIGSKCKKIVPFTSSYSFIGTENPSLFELKLKNSFIGSLTFAIVNNDFSQRLVYVGGNDSLDIITIPFIDEKNNFYVYNTLDGLYKKCKYASEDLNIFIPSANSASSASIIETFKKNSRSSDEFHKLLDSKPNLKKKYLQLKAKQGK